MPTVATRFLWEEEPNFEQQPERLQLPTVRVTKF